MGGWIKLEKDLRDDVRVRRMAVALQGAKHGNGTALQPVTLVLGGLTQLWMHADSFARDDDTLEISLDEIDELTGIKGFAKTLPPDWLEVLDEHTVKLPGFHDHNGSDAKRRALTAKRVEKHRKRISVTASTQLVTPERYQTRPDQTRLDQKKQEAAAPHGLPNGNGKASEPELHASLPRDAWQEWLTYRRSRSLPLTPITLRKQLTLLSRFSTEEQRTAIDTSIQAGWQGLFPGGRSRSGQGRPGLTERLAALGPEDV